MHARTVPGKESTQNETFSDLRIRFRWRQQIDEGRNSQQVRPLRRVPGVSLIKQFHSSMTLLLNKLECLAKENIFNTET
jgi:hypothetical protein